jgi:hypothetical protein
VALEDLGDKRSVGEGHALERSGVLQVSKLLNAQRRTHRSRDIGTGDTLWRSVKEVESIRLADLSDNLGSNTER